MFKSKSRPVVIPQSEHLKLAGTLASLWGNADFDAPKVDRNSLIAGIGLHDRAYGSNDSLAVGEMPEQTWIELTRSGFYMPCSDPVADLITRHHLLRLAASSQSAARIALAHEFEQAIELELRENGLSPELFRRIDRITHLCDSISFDFCFELPIVGRIPVYPRNDSSLETFVQYRVEGQGIRVGPWPFSVGSISGTILGYNLKDYPVVLDPVIIPYSIT